jgi:CHAT domain-containing protein
MKYYIHNLKKGIVNIEALKNAKIAMIKSKYSNPYFWAGFVLQGKFDYEINN